jgi:WD40 repeat protein
LTNVIATACSDNSIHLLKERLNTDSGISMSEYETSIELLHRQDKAHSQDCNCVEWHPKIGNLLTSCSDDGTIKLWAFYEQN